MISKYNEILFDVRSGLGGDINGLIIQKYIVPNRNIRLNHKTLNIIRSLVLQKN